MDVCGRAVVLCDRWLLHSPEQQRIHLADMQRPAVQRKTLQTLNQKSFLKDFVNFWR